ncbi:MAG: hypothetical protein KGQ66_03245 [Acidobacteriota bacterium]|nr:hypothetical protein [Acidobacteriota bacterium]
MRGVDVSAKDDDWMQDLDMDEWNFIDSHETPTDIPGVFADPTWSELFRRYAETDFAENEYNFYLAVADYENSPSRERGSQMYQIFVAPGAPSEVNLQGPTVAALREWFGYDMSEWTSNLDPSEEDQARFEKGTVTDPPADVFAAARKDVTVNLSDVYLRWILAVSKAQKRTH